MILHHFLFSANGTRGEQRVCLRTLMRSFAGAKSLRSADTSPRRFGRGELPLEVNPHRDSRWTQFFQIGTDGFCFSGLLLSRSLPFGAPSNRRIKCAWPDPQSCHSYLIQQSFIWNFEDRIRLTKYSVRIWKNVATAYGFSLRNLSLALSRSYSGIRCKEFLGSNNLHKSGQWVSAALSVQKSVSTPSWLTMSKSTLHLLTRNVLVPLRLLP